MYLLFFATLLKICLCVCVRALQNDREASDKHRASSIQLAQENVVLKAKVSQTLALLRTYEQKVRLPCKRNGTCKIAWNLYRRTKSD